MIPPHSLLPSINAPPPLPSPAYSGYKSCWLSLRTLSTVVCMRSVFTIYGCCVQFQCTLVILCTNILSWNYWNNPLPPPCDAPLPKNDPPKRIKILKEKMSRPTRDTPLSDVGLLFSLCAYRAVPCGGAGRALPPVFLVWRHRDQSNGLSGPQTLCFSNTMSYLKFFAPLVSKGLLQPRLMHLQIPFWACVALK